MPRERPGAVTAAAVMSIIYGSLGALCGLCLASMLVTHGALGDDFLGQGNDAQDALQKELDAALDENAPGNKAVQLVAVTAGLAVSLALLIGGIGLLNMAGWARKLTLLGCLVGICDAAGYGFYLVAVAIPAYNQVLQVALPAAMKKQGLPPPADFKQKMQAMEMALPVASVLIGVVFLAAIIYLTVIIILLTRRHVRAAFVGMPSFTGLENDQLDRERRESRRRDDYDDDDWTSPPPPPNDLTDDRFRAK